MNKTEIEYCPDCLKGLCESHGWLGKPKTPKEILIKTLKHLSGILPAIIEKVYLVETVLYDNDERFFTGGKIEFIIKTDALHKKEGYYIPVLSISSMWEEMVNFHIEVHALIIRHNPITLKISEGCITKNWLYSVDLIKENDFLHCEMIQSYPDVVSLAKERLKQFCAEIDVEGLLQRRK